MILAIIGAQIVAITVTCPLIVDEEGSFAIGCMLIAFEVPAEAAMAKLPTGSVISAPFSVVHVER